MAIAKLSTHKLSNNLNYFLDSNVWLMRFKQVTELNTSELVYVDFVDQILEKSLPIYTHSLVTSEVFNAYMRITYKEYVNDLYNDPMSGMSKKEIDDYEFKTFRGTSTYDFHLKIFKDDFKAYSPGLKFLDKEISVKDAQYLVNNLPPNSDFNDFFFQELSVDHKLHIITHDADFKYSSIPILTQNNRLLKYGK